MRPWRGRIWSTSSFSPDVVVQIHADRFACAGYGALGAGGV
jgi:hypothetical protein